MIRRLSVITAAALLLAGCAVTSPPQTSSGPTGTPSPSATATPSSLPLPTLPVACADVFSDQDVSALLGTPATLRLAEATLRNIFDAASLQAGALSCTWGGDSKTDNSWDESIVLIVLPDADNAFDTGVWQVDDGAIVYPEGELSEYLCDANSLNGCFANVLLDGYWAQVQARSPGLGEAQMRTIVDTVRTSLTGAAAARPAWTAPSEAVSGAYCGTLEQPTGSAARYAQLIAQWRSGLATCTAPDGTRISVLPAGAWSVAGMGASGERPFWSVDPLQPVTVEGTDAAFGAASIDEGYYLVVSARGSAIVLSGSADVPADQFLAAAPALIAEIVAAG